MANEENKDYYSELEQRKMGARNAQAEEEGEWARDFENDLNNDKNSEEWDDFIDEHNEKYRTNDAKSEKDKKQLSARRRIAARAVIKKIRKERFDGLPFYSALFLAMTKDIIDLVTFGTIGIIVGIAIEGVIGVIFLLNGSSRVETKIKRAVYMNLIEKIPILNILPLGTGFIIYVKIKQNNKVAGLEQKLRKLRK